MDHNKIKRANYAILFINKLHNNNKNSVESFLSPFSQNVVDNR